ncbi:hypothetical protein HMN09_00263300 [Mycena chlorophos]|uniref:Large ribosomal subunit protein uL14m n=1 Tax=Mycena chlorophos TaxID=658473 RepID=A0A8H6TIA7_MYCCL|nr:hypothetical protein HMN09_00263300 [Mycena chlorophos]
MQPAAFEHQIVYGLQTAFRGGRRRCSEEWSGRLNGTRSLGILALVAVVSRKKVYGVFRDWPGQPLYGSRNAAMIGLKGTLNIIDNSGALVAECVNVLKQKVNNGWGSVGDEIVVVVQRARPVSAAAAASVTAVKVRRGDVRRAVIVRTRKEVRRPDGRIVRFDDNAAVLLNNKREMLGTRIAGVVSADLRMKGWGKIASLAPKVL